MEGVRHRKFVSRLLSYSDQVELRKLFIMRFEFASAKNLRRELEIQSQSFKDKKVYHSDKKISLITGLSAPILDAKTYQTDRHSTITAKLIFVQNLLSIHQRLKLLSPSQRHQPDIVVLYET